MAFRTSFLLTLSAVGFGCLLNNLVAGEGAPPPLKRPEIPLGFLAQPEEENRFVALTASATISFGPLGLSWRNAHGNLISQTFRNANRALSLTGRHPMEGRVNRYRGADQQTWHSSQHLFRELIYREVYPGIDVVFRGEKGRLKRDFIVAPGADPNLIRMAFSGIENLALDARGGLLVDTGGGVIHESRPFIYQESGGMRKVVSGHFRLNAKQDLGFVVGTYDPTLPLIIDPTIISVGLLGGSDNDALLTAYATDTAYYFAGVTNSTDFPTVNPAQATPGGDPAGVGDAFLVCFDKATMQLNYATYFGGSGTDQATGLFVDGSGNLYMAGWTNSTDFPVLNAIQPSPGGLTDGFLACFSPGGTLTWATYFGGSGDDQFADLDGNSLFGQLTAVGFSNSTDMTTQNAGDTTPGGTGAIYVRTLLDGTLDTATFLGGSATDVALDVTVVGETAFVVGWTESTDFPKQPFTQDHAGGRDAFLARFRFNGRRNFSLLLGGPGDEEADGVAAFSETVIVTGSTTSNTGFPVTANASQGNYGGGGSDAFIARINTDTSPLVRSLSYHGGSDSEAGREILLLRDPPQFLTRFIIGGVTRSDNLPLGGGNTGGVTAGLDSFLLTGEAQGNNDFQILDGSLFGGSGDDGIFALSSDSTQGPFHFLAAGTSSDPAGLPTAPRATTGIKGPSTGDRNERSLFDGGFFASICALQCNLTQPNLTVTMDPTPSGVLRPGDQFELALNVTNLGPGIANDVNLNLELPKSFGILALPDDCMLLDGGFSEISCNLADLGVAESIQFSVIALAHGLNLFNVDPRSTVVVEATNGELDPSDNVAVSEFPLNAEAPSGGGATNFTLYLPESVGDPISTANGAFFFEKPLLNLGGPMPLSASLIYSSDLPSLVNNVNLPHFWFRPFATLVPDITVNGQTYTTAQLPGGDIVSFVKNATDWDLVRGNVDMGATVATGNSVITPYELLEQNGWFYLSDPRMGRIYLFERVGDLGLIRAVMDRNSNTHRYLYANGDGEPPSAVEDGLGRRLDFTYLSIAGSLNVYLSTITDQGGRQVSFSYEPVGADNAGQVTLRSVTDAMGQTTAFEYAGPDLPPHRMTGKTLANGDLTLRQAYAYQTLNGFQEQRVISQTQVAETGSNGTTEPLERLAFDPNSTEVTHTDVFGESWKYESVNHHGQTTKITDPQGNQTLKTLGPDGRVNQITDRAGRNTTLHFHEPSGQLAHWTDSGGGIFAATHVENLQNFTNPVSGDSFALSFYDVTRRDFPDGTFSTQILDGRGNPIQWVDRGGDAFVLTYNSRGQNLSLQNPSGGSRILTYDSNGNLSTATDGETGTTTFGYDNLFRLTAITMPPNPTKRSSLSETLTFSWNHNDQLIQVVDTRGQGTTFSYDTLDQLTGITGPDGDAHGFVRNRFGIPTAHTDPTNRIRMVTVSAGHQVTEFDDGSGVPERLSYNRSGFLHSFRRDGKGYDVALDEEGLPLGFTTSDGLHTSTIQRDDRGLIVGLRTPQGRQYSFTRDPLGRITQLVQPSGRTIERTLDADGDLTRLIFPGGAEYQVARNPLGLGEIYTDPAGNAWLHAFSPMGRLISHTDPLGRQTTFLRDPSGRVQQATLANGTTVDVTRDGELLSQLDFTPVTAARNKTPLSLSFAYDNRNNMTAADGVTLNYDLANRLVGWSRGTVSFNQTYDGAGRLETITYPNNGMTVTYTYDPQGLLASVSDDLTGTLVQINYDLGGRRTALTRSNGVHATYSYSPDGFPTILRETDSQGNTFIDLQNNYDSDGRLKGQQGSLPLNREQNLPEGDAVFTYDAAAQISNPPYNHDPLGRLTQHPNLGNLIWDPASRLVGAGTTQFTYDGLGHLTSRIDGLTTVYHTHPHMGSTRVLMEEQTNQNGSGKDQFYVFTPDGRLLYGVDRTEGNLPFFYHFDNNGHTLAVTDHQGLVNERYAYDPFGALVDSSITKSGSPNEQIFLTSGETGTLSLVDGVLFGNDGPFLVNPARRLKPSPDFGGIRISASYTGHPNPYGGFQGNKPIGDDILLSPDQTFTLAGLMPGIEGADTQQLSGVHRSGEKAPIFAFLVNEAMLDVSKPGSAFLDQLGPGAEGSAGLPNPFGLGPGTLILPPFTGNLIETDERFVLDIGTLQNEITFGNRTQAPESSNGVSIIQAAPSIGRVSAEDREFAELNFLGFFGGQQTPLPREVIFALRHFLGAGQPIPE